MKALNVELLSIPPRSPDVNPIENLFNLVGGKLKHDAVVQNITRENFNEFTARVVKTLTEFPSSEIDKVIESMDKRMKLLIKGKGERLKY